MYSENLWWEDPKFYDYTIYFDSVLIQIRSSSKKIMTIRFHIVGKKLLFFFLQIIENNYATSISYRLKQNYILLTVQVIPPVLLKKGHITFSFSVTIVQILLNRIYNLPLQHEFLISYLKNVRWAAE